MRLLRSCLFVAGVLLLGYLVLHVGTGPIVEAVSRLAWWQFALLCLPHVVVMAVDTLGWRYAFAQERVPFLTLFAARVAGDALNLVTAVASVGGEAVKAWLIRQHVRYEDSIPSLVIAKTTSTIGQGLFLILGLVVTRFAVDPGSHLWQAMLWLLLVECVAIGGFVLAQLTGLIARAGRLLRMLGSSAGAVKAQRLDASLRDFYRHQWRRLLASTGFHLVGWALGAVETFLILWTLDVPVSMATAVVIEAFGAAVRFATFLVPASIGVLEGANAGALAALGAGAGAGLAFSFVRRARQVVWVGLGLIFLVAMRSPGWAAPDAGRAMP
jgi:glycosyltransferase 2 family protein